MRFDNTPHIRQYAGLKFCPLSSNGSGVYSKGSFYWEFDAKPSLFSKTYRVLIVWDFTFVTPKVYILNNELHEVARDKQIPHLYSAEKIQLCLFYPEYNEFNEFMPLCDTIIPWTYLWLMYYEEWLYSGTWKGGDAPHSEVPIVEEDTNKIHKSSPSDNVQYLKKSTTDRIYEKRKRAFDKQIILE